MKKNVIRLNEQQLKKIVAESVKKVLKETRLLKENECSDIYELFDEFDTDTITVSDFRIVADGSLVTCIHLTDDGIIQIWAGNPNTDKYAEELKLSNSERRRVFEEILENF